MGVVRVFLLACLALCLRDRSHPSHAYHVHVPLASHRLIVSLLSLTVVYWFSDLLKGCFRIYWTGIGMLKSISALSLPMLCLH